MYQSFSQQAYVLLSITDCLQSFTGTVATITSLTDFWSECFHTKSFWMQLQVVIFTHVQDPKSNLNEERGVISFLIPSTGH